MSISPVILSGLMCLIQVISAERQTIQITDSLLFAEPAAEADRTGHIPNNTESQTIIGKFIAENWIIQSGPFDGHPDEPQPSPNSPLKRFEIRGITIKRLGQINKKSQLHGLLVNYNASLIVDGLVDVDGVRRRIAKIIIGRAAESLRDKRGPTENVDGVEFHFESTVELKYTNGSERESIETVLQPLWQIALEKSTGGNLTGLPTIAFVRETDSGANENIHQVVYSISGIADEPEWNRDRFDRKLPIDATAAQRFFSELIAAGAWKDFSVVMLGKGTSS